MRDAESPLTEVTAPISLKMRAAILTPPVFMPLVFESADAVLAFEAPLFQSLIDQFLKEHTHVKRTQLLQKLSELVSNVPECRTNRVAPPHLFRSDPETGRMQIMPLSTINELDSVFSGDRADVSNSSAWKFESDHARADVALGLCQSVDIAALASMPPFEPALRAAWDLLWHSEIPSEASDDLLLELSHAPIAQSHECTFTLQDVLQMLQGSFECDALLLRLICGSVTVNFANVALHLGLGLLHNSDHISDSPDVRLRHVPGFTHHNCFTVATVCHLLVLLRRHESALQLLRAAAHHRMLNPVNRTLQLSVTKSAEPIHSDVSAMELEMRALAKTLSSFVHCARTQMVTFAASCCGVAAIELLRTNLQFTRERLRLSMSPQDRRVLSVHANTGIACIFRFESNNTWQAVSPVVNVSEVIDNAMRRGKLLLGQRVMLIDVPHLADGLTGTIVGVHLPTSRYNSNEHGKRQVGAEVLLDAPWTSGGTCDLGGRVQCSRGVMLSDARAQVVPLAALLDRVLWASRSQDRRLRRYN
ncbi:MAG: hypothetical protein MHM6MM_007380 [Cercozoa sp. M6MM]